MQTIRRKISLILLACIAITLILIFTLVNFTINSQFKEYLKDNQVKRDTRIVNYLTDIYIRDNKWERDAGLEIQHEAYMGNFCVTLMDKDRNIIWGMDPKDLLNSLNNMRIMHTSEGGIYKSKEYEIKNNSQIVGYVDIGQYSSILLSQEDVQFENAINKSILISTFITLLLTMMLALYISKEFSSPIKRISNISMKLAAGDFTEINSKQDSIVEFENLRNSINTLANKLNYQAILRKRLVSDISHEIRTPLNILQNNLEAMIDDIIPTDKEKLEALNNEVIRFGALLNDLDTLKQFESEGLKLNMAKLSLGVLINEVVNEFHISLKQKNITLNYKNNCKNDYILGDRGKLKQVFINLMSNAIKFTNENGFVNINLNCHGNFINVEISDNGVGIKSEDIPYIFEYLYRGDKSRQSVEGNGIGLTLVKDILELHSAKINVESEENVGSKFTISFNSL